MEDQAPPTPLLGSCRLALALVGFLGFVNLYALRVNLSLAMVCMVNHTALTPAHTDIFNSTHLSTNKTVYDEDGRSYEGSNYNMSSEPLSPGCALQNSGEVGSMQDGQFVWSKEVQGIVLGAFFWGYMCTQLPGGYLAGRYGGKHVLGWSMLVAAIATLLTPIGASYSPYVLVALRVILGLGEGVVFPAMHALWSCWAPPLERTTLIGFTYAGAQIGNVLTIPISALLCEYGFAGGWPSIFYVFGSIGVLWFVLWIWFVSDSPSQHPRISEEEKKYIISTQGTDSQRTLQKSMGTPWKSFFGSSALWAIIVAHVCSNWGTYTLLTNIPTYMKEVLKFNIKKNGVLSALPYIMFWACINIGGLATDKMRSKGIDTVHARKISLAMGTFFPGLFLVVLAWIPCTQPAAAVAVLVLAVGFSGFQYSGCMVNHLDIAPPFAGVLFGITNTLASLPGFLAPYTVGKITTTQSQQEWQVVFYIAAGIYAFGGTFYSIFGQGHIQPWCKPYMQLSNEDEMDEKVTLHAIEKDDEQFSVDI